MTSLCSKMQHEMHRTTMKYFKFAAKTYKTRERWLFKNENICSRIRQSLNFSCRLWRICAGRNAEGTYCWEIPPTTSMTGAHFSSGSFEVRDHSAGADVHRLGGDSSPGGAKVQKIRPCRPWKVYVKVHGEELRTWLAWVMHVDHLFVVRVSRYYVFGLVPLDHATIWSDQNWTFGQKNSWMVSLFIGLVPCHTNTIANMPFLDFEAMVVIQHSSV